MLKDDEESNETIDECGDHDQQPPHSLQIAETIQEYFENPLKFQPHPDFIKDSYFVEEDTTLILAIRNLNVPAVSGLLCAGINPNAPNQKGVTPISAASHKGDTVIIQHLVDAGAAVNAINSTGSTALIQASHFGHLDAVQLLLAHGGIADFANSKGTTALMRASQEGYVDIVVVLLGSKSEVNRKNNEGMNSLMLASQRGHDQVVLVLVKYGAAMDEQTSQGSTALMLACKRGHESVVEVLVACGAEIYMRDCRARSARDTALRRHHSSLLTHLDTQVQVRSLQDTARSERAELLKTMREASILNQLQYSPETMRILRIMQGVERYECQTHPHSQSHSQSSPVLLPPPGQRADRLIGPEDFHRVVQQVMGSAAPPTAAGYCTSYAHTMTTAASSSSSSSSSSSEATTSPLYRNTWTFPTDICMANINSPVSSSFIASAPYRARHPLPTPPLMRPHRPGYAPWQWPVLLKRVFDLPLGVHELVISFLPTPRIWKTCIDRLKRRVTLAPQVATLDISIMLDEMITDMCLFRPPTRQGYLVLLSRNEAVQQYLSEQWHMPSALVAELVQWSDVQSLITRSADCDVTFKANLARKFLQLAISMHRYLSSSSNPRVLFSLSRLRASGSSAAGNSKVNCSNSGNSRTASRGAGGGGGHVSRLPSWASPGFGSTSSVSASASREVGSASASGSGSGGHGGHGDRHMDQEGEGEGCSYLMDIDFLLDEDVDVEDRDRDRDRESSVRGGGAGAGGLKSASSASAGSGPPSTRHHQHQHHQHSHHQQQQQHHESFQMLPPPPATSMTTAFQQHPHPHQHPHQQQQGGGGGGGGGYLEEEEEEFEEEEGEEDYVMQEQSDDDDDDDI